MTRSFLRQRQGYAKSKGMPTPPFDPHQAAPPLPKRPLPEAALRALAEAAARRSEGAKGETEKAGALNEVGGRGGLDPTRYGDWEVSGLASDF
jgi:hypothetical protein